MQTFAACAVALLAACPINPTIDDAGGKQCASPDDLCPTGFDCYEGKCTSACSATSACSKSKTASANILSPVECHCASDCACPQVCTPDPYWVDAGYFSVCEDTCPGAVSTECSDGNTVCETVAGINVCELNQCFTPDGFCSVGVLANAGTCYPILGDGGSECRAGNLDARSDAGCDDPNLTASRTNENALCPPGYFCDSTKRCEQVCNPKGLLSSCTGGKTCVSLPSDPLVGLCQ